MIDQLAKAAGRSGITLPLFASPAISSYIDPRMYEYLATNHTLAKLSPMFGAGFSAIINTKDVYNGILKWWIRCSLTENCISPPKCKLRCPKGKNPFLGDWIKCHRFDQSALNLLLLHHFKGETCKYTAAVCGTVLRRIFNMHFHVQVCGQ